MLLKEKLMHLMKEQSLTQKELASKASVTEASLSKYLNGVRTPRIDVVVKLAKALNTTPNCLLDDVTAEENSYDVAYTTLARCKEGLTDEEKKKLLKFLLED